MYIKMVTEDLNFIFDALDIDCKGYIEWIELKEFDEELFHNGLDIEQIESAINMVKFFFLVAKKKFSNKYFDLVSC